MPIEPVRPRISITGPAKHAVKNSPSPGSLGSCEQESFTPKESQQGNERQTENGKIIAANFLEQMGAKPLKLIAADACLNRRSGHREITIEERVRERPHDHVRRG